MFYILLSYLGFIRILYRFFLENLGTPDDIQTNTGNHEIIKMSVFKTFKVSIPKLQ